MNDKLILAKARYNILLRAGEDRVDALCHALNSVASTWYEYAKLYRMIVDEL